MANHQQKPYKRTGNITQNESPSARWISLFFPFHLLLVRLTLKKTANDPKLTHWAGIISFARYRFGDSFPSPSLSSCLSIQIERQVLTNAEHLTLIWLNDRDFDVCSCYQHHHHYSPFAGGRCLCVQVFVCVGIRQTLASTKSQPGRPQSDQSAELACQINAS